MSISSEGTGTYEKKNKQREAGSPCWSAGNCCGPEAIDCGGEAEKTASKAMCASCPMRARYDRNPKSLMGRMWRWHIKFCPGWKSYMRGLSEEERAAVAEKYNLKK